MSRAVSIFTQFVVGLWADHLAFVPSGYIHILNLASGDLISQDLCLLARLNTWDDLCAALSIKQSCAIFWYSKMSVKYSQYLHPCWWKCWWLPGIHAEWSVNITQLSPKGFYIKATPAPLPKRIKGLVYCLVPRNP